MVTVLQLNQYVVLAQQKAHFVVEEDLNSIVAEQKH